MQIWHDGYTTKQAIGPCEEADGVHHELAAHQLFHWEKCLGGHEHVHLLGGRAREAQKYPEALCHHILAGLRQQLLHDGHIKNNNDLYSMDYDDSTYAYMSTFVDDLSGKA